MVQAIAGRCEIFSYHIDNQLKATVLGYGHPWVMVTIFVNIYNNQDIHGLTLTVPTYPVVGDFIVFTHESLKQPSWVEFCGSIPKRSKKYWDIVRNDLVGLRITRRMMNGEVVYYQGDFYERDR